MSVVRDHSPPIPKCDENRGTPGKFSDEFLVETNAKTYLAKCSTHLTYQFMPIFTRT